MKKINVFGKQIPVLIVIGLLFAGLGSAALVSYLSNEAEVSVTVESPVLLEVSTDGADYSSNPATLSFGNIYGGESVTFWIRDTNLANVITYGSSTKLVTNVDGVTCDDFVSMTASGSNLLSICKQIDSKTIDFSAYSSGELAANGDDGYFADNKVELTFKSGASGTYTFTMQKMVI